MIRFLFVLLSIAGNLIFSQSALSTNDFLKTSFDDIEVKNQSKILASIKTLKFHQPWLKSVNARIGITGSALGDTIYGYLRNEDNYALFIEPNSLRETRWQKRIKSSKIELYEAEQNQFLENAIHVRYEVLIDYYWLNIWLKLINERDSLNNQKVEWIKKGVALLQNLDIDDVLRADREKSDLAIRKEKFRLQELALKLEISNLSNISDFSKLEVNDIINLNNIEVFCNMKQSDTSLFISSEEKLSESKINYLSTKSSYINSQNRKILNDFRFSYDDPLYLVRPNKFNTFNNFSFRVGFNVPIPSNNRLRKAESQLDILEERLNLQKQKANRLNNINNLSNELKTILKEYESFVKLINESMVYKLISNPQTNQIVSPIEWIDLHLRMNEYEEKKLKIEEQIFKKYFQLLKAQGVLSQSPYKNYLLKSQAIWFQ